MDVWTLMRFLHVVALAFFIGGQLVLAVAIVPAVRRHADETTMRSIARRFGIGSALALVVLLATGAAMAAQFVRWEDSVLQIKLMVVVLVGVLVAFHIASPANRAISVAVLVTSLLVAWLGVELSH